ncbi:MAG: DUF4286 family protein [Fulvivirga sp.]|nr:DUF4286 family protein [Fulvivirga sp.]
MVLYNVTVGIDTDIEGEWLDWMQKEHIPAVMATGMFKEHKVFKVLNQEEESSVSYSIQYFAENIDMVVKYLDDYAPPLVEAHRERFKNRHVAFRTLLEQV